MLHLDVMNFFQKYRRIDRNTNKDLSNDQIRLKMFMKVKTLIKGSCFGELALINS